MVLGCGVDLVHIGRMERAVARWGELFLQRVYTPHERAHGQRRAKRFEFYAARFAAKEAVMKAFGAWRGGLACPFQSIEVRVDSSGRPLVRLSGIARQLQRRSRATDIFLSLSHTDEHAMATVVLARNRR